MTHLEDLLSALVDGELAGAELDAAAAHLAGCPRCRAERDALARTKLMVAALPAVRPPRAVERFVARYWFRRAAPWAGVALAAVVVLLALPADHHAVAPSLTSMVRLRAAGPAPAAPARARRRSVAAPFVAPAELAGGYRLVGVERRAGTMEADYSDGSLRLSVFEQPGWLDAARLRPAQGQDLTLRSDGARRYTWWGGQVVVWQSGSMIYAVVGDAEADALQAVVRSVPDPHGLGLWSRLRRASRRLLTEIRGGAASDGD